MENKREKFQLCKMRKLIEAVRAGAEREGLVWNDQRGAWDVGSTVRLYENVVRLVEYPTKNEKIRRNTQISWLTIYNLYVSHGRNITSPNMEVCKQYCYWVALMFTVLSPCLRRNHI